VCSMDPPDQPLKAKVLRRFDADCESLEARGVWVLDATPIALINLLAQRYRDMNRGLPLGILNSLTGGDIADRSQGSQGSVQPPSAKKRVITNEHRNLLSNPLGSTPTKQTILSSGRSTDPADEGGLEGGLPVPPLSCRFGGAVWGLHCRFPPPGHTPDLRRFREPESLV
jgi:hypothetical protein